MQRFVVCHNPDGAERGAHGTPAAHQAPVERTTVRINRATAARLLRTSEPTLAAEDLAAAYKQPLAA